MDQPHISTTSGLGENVYLAAVVEKSRRLEAERRFQAVGAAAAAVLSRPRSLPGVVDGGSERGLLGLVVDSSWAIGLARGCTLSPRHVPAVSRAFPSRIGIFSFLSKSKKGILLGYSYLSRIWRIGVSATY